MENPQWCACVRGVSPTLMQHGSKTHSWSRIAVLPITAVTQKPLRIYLPRRRYSGGKASFPAWSDRIFCFISWIFKLFPSANSGLRVKMRFWCFLLFYYPLHSHFEQASLKSAVLLIFLYPSDITIHYFTWPFSLRSAFQRNHQGNYSV